jgi:hypothetical protein
MPNYEFEYTGVDGRKHRIERHFRMSECPKWVEMDDGAIAYRIISLNARMNTNWDSYSPSDLPPENAP